MTHNYLIIDVSILGERTINGKQFDMEFYIVNQAEDEYLGMFGIISKIEQEMRFFLEFGITLKPWIYK